jgi:hypothetical protein
MSSALRLLEAGYVLYWEVTMASAVGNVMRGHQCQHPHVYECICQGLHLSVIMVGWRLQT